jgi:tRNA modification GTPase
MTEETIVAMATPPGRGGVGIIRLSGPHAFSIAQTITHLSSINPRTAHYCSFYDQTDEIIDQGLLLYFKSPHSFTGEDVIEFQVHGAPMVMDRLIQITITLGARVARPGEFSQRAFLNDKIDLTQAEAIADLIHASSQTAARMAVRSLQGDFSKKIHELNEKLIQLRLYVEAAIDFPEEEIDFLNDGKIAGLLQDALANLYAIKGCATQGAIMREGLSVVIAGRPNAGKSTLINALAGRDIAIVTHHAGTTRDVMREHVLLDDIPLHVVDTAGLRDSDDPVEQEGIKRAWIEVQRADCVLLLADVQQPFATEDLSLEIRAALPEGVPVIQVFNKIDLLAQRPAVDKNSVYISAKLGEGMGFLKEKIKEVVGYQPQEGTFLARRRHLQAMDQALFFLENGQHQLSSHRAGELLAEDLRQAHQALCEITGEFSSDDLLGVIFSSFCIGK